MLYHPGGKAWAVPAASVLSLFSLATSLPALVVTSLIGINAVLLRAAMAALLAPFLNWLITSILWPNPGEREPEAEQIVPFSINKSVLEAVPGSSSLVRVSWRSFTGQVSSALLPLLIGFILASALTVHVPAYTIRPWLGDGVWWAPFLAALLAIPFQLSGGAEVPLASALLVKGASLGTALSVMLASPIATSSAVRRLFQPARVGTVAAYLLTVWLAAGFLGAAVDGAQRLFA